DFNQTFSYCTETFFALRCQLEKPLRNRTKTRKNTFWVFFGFLWFSPCFSNWPLGGINKNTSQT
ncbi:MAG: hypothetical protein J6Y15_11695, partial [Bacteroidaceae bacterium]|nr:hypothetical protein [Bacteroidaceae bacterium]